VHLLVSQNGEQLFNDLVGHSFPAVEYRVQIENSLLHFVFVAEFEVLAQSSYLRALRSFQSTLPSYPRA